MYVKSLFAILIFILMSITSYGQGGEVQDEKEFRNVISLSSSVYFLENDAGTMNTVDLSLKHYVYCFGKYREWAECLWLRLQLQRVFVFNDPWQNMPPLFPPKPQPDPWNDFNLNELEIGAGWIFAPTVGIDFRLADRISLGVYGGGGFHYASSQETELAGGTFRTTVSSSPLLTAGLEAGFDVTDQVGITIGFQGLNTFENNMTVIGPDGSMAIFEGMSMFTPGVNAGVEVGF